MQVHATQHSVSTPTPQIVFDELTVQAPIEALPPVSRSRRRPVLLFTLLLALLVIVAFGVAFGLYAGRLHHAASVTGSRAPQTPTVQTFPYPPLAGQYIGTIDDIVANSKTNMSLSNIRQSGKNIDGYFAGLDLPGPFKGTIDASGHITFQVAIYSGASTLSFEGSIQIGGNIAGSYRVLNQNKQFTGEMGLWSVAPQSVEQSL